MSIIAFVCYILQTSLVDGIQIYGIKPNLIIIITISYALVRGRRDGAILGAILGLILDIMSGKIIGLFALLGLYLGYIIGSLNKNLYKENYLIPILLTAAGSFVYNFVFYIFTCFVKTQSQIGWYIIGYFIPETIYNTLLSIVIYFLILYINNKLDYYSKSPRIY